MLSNESAMKTEHSEKCNVMCGCLPELPESVRSIFSPCMDLTKAYKENALQMGNFRLHHKKHMNLFKNKLSSIFTFVITQYMCTYEFQGHFVECFTLYKQ